MTTFFGGLRRFSGMGFILVAALAVSACGKDSASPTAPTAPAAPAAPTVTSVTVAGLDALRTGFIADYTATAVMSDGSTQAVTSTATWASSNAAFGSVEATGRLTGRTHGPMAVTATYQGRSGTKNVNIVNNYGGTWAGQYTATACDASGAFKAISWCQGVVGVPEVLSMVVTQGGNDRSSVSGTLTNLFIKNAPFTGTVTADGRLVINTDSTGTSSSGLTFRFQLGGWDTRKTSPTQMTGRTAVSFSAVGLPGNAYEEHNITTVTLSNPQLAPLAER